jgi:hypothetical protein
MSEWSEWIEHDGAGVPDRILGVLTQAYGEAFDGFRFDGEGVIVNRDDDICRAWDWSFFRRKSPVNAWR